MAEDRGEAEREKAEERRLLRKGYKENLGYLYLMGCSYVSGNLSKISIFVFYILSLTHILFLFITALVSSDDLGLRFEAAHWCMMLSNTTMASMIVIRHRESLDRIFTVMGRQFHDYGSTIDDETRKEIDCVVEKSEKWRNLIVKSFIFSVITTGGFLTTARSAYELVTGRLQSPRRENGIVTCIPVTMWYPVDFVGWYKVIAIAIQYYQIGITGCLILAVDLGFVTQAHAVNTQFEILALTLKKFDRRAKHLFAVQSSMKLKGDKASIESCIRFCINESVKHHQILIKFCQDLYTYSYMLLMTIVSVSTFLICLSAYVFSADVMAMVKFTFFCFLLTEMVHCYLYCWYSQRILDTHKKVRLSLFSANWIEHSQVIRPYWLVVQARSNVDLGISAGGVQIVSLTVFINVVLRSAFSYYSVLQTNTFKGKAH